MSESHDQADQRQPAVGHWEEGLWTAESSMRARVAILQPPILAREIVALLLLVLLSDLTVYRSQGYAGPATFFLILPILLWLGTVRIKYQPGRWLLLSMIFAVSLRLFWCGSPLAIFTGFVVLICFTMSLAGLPPYMTWAVAFASRLVAAGLRGLKGYAHALARFNPVIPRARYFAIGMPIVTLIIFSTIFVMANPDLVKSFGIGLTRIVEFMQRWIEQFDLGEIIFCGGACWIATGLLRPEFQTAEHEEAHRVKSDEPAISPLFEGYRNTLLVVIGLFAVYLIFEFQTLWFRSFPQGFHYSGYAHEGAAWLTIALGLATVLLSIMFRGTILADPRCSQLRVLSWIWSLENLILAGAVFNRMWIYVGFNGMTQMRVVGILGAASVIAGFIFVHVKIAYENDFTWLLRRQLWAVSIAFFIYAVFPVDAYVNSFNVRRITAGDPAPSVQISVHRTSDEGYLMLAPLVDCSNLTIRDGVRGLLQIKLESLELKRTTPHSGDWTSFQLANTRLLNQLRSLKLELENESTVRERAAAIEAFHKYAYQWY